MKIDVLRRHALVALALSFLLSPLTARAQADDSTESTLEQAVEFYSAKEYDRAAAKLMIATRRDPENKDLWYWLGTTRMQQKRWDDARDAFKKLRDLDPKNVAAPKGIAETYVAQKQSALAVLWYQRALEISPDDEQLQAALAEARELEPAPAATSEDQPDEEADSPAQAAETEEFLRRGFVGKFSADNRIWGHVIGVLAFLILPVWVTQICIKTYRLPLSPSELNKTAVIVAIAQIVMFLVAWGYEPHWRMILGGIGVVVFAAAARNAAKGQSVRAIATVLRDPNAREEILNRMRERLGNRR